MFRVARRGTKPRAVTKKRRGQELELRDGDSVTLAPPLGEFLRDVSYPFIGLGFRV